MGAVVSHLPLLRNPLVSAPKYDARPFTLFKTRKGYGACTWTLEKKGSKRVAARYAILNRATGNILALSVKVAASAEKKVLDAQFQHLLDTAVIK
jgi:hypothetical protein